MNLTLWIIIFCVITIVTGLLRLAWLRRYRLSPVSVQSFGLGTVIQMTAYGPNAQKALDEVIEQIGIIDDQMSYYKTNSDITKINQHAGGPFQTVNQATYTVIKEAVEYSRLSDGALDLTVRPVLNLWGIGTEKTIVPRETELQNSLALVNYRDLEFDDATQAIRLKKPGQAIDLNCIAKGYAADVVHHIFTKYHIPNGLINLGGNIYAHGSKPDGNPWTIGIQHPLMPRGHYIGYLSVTDRSVVTSGDYEKYFLYQNRKYHHIIDPKTGYPVHNTIISTTIISRSSIDGDALTTCLYVLGIDRGLRLIEDFRDIEAIIITEDRLLYGTKNIRKTFQITDTEFHWGELHA